MMEFFKLLARNRLALGGLIVMGIVVLLALITPLLPVRIIWGAIF
jgi:peptide/nickel transport system permease protein